jgi:peptide/nickel transport system ATP-binding protein
MEQQNETFLSVKNLTVEYTSEGRVIHAVNDVSFELEKGKTIGLVGETGAGKTTIAKTILSILPVPPARVQNGEIWFEGEDMMKMEESKLRHIRGAKISMVFQDPMTALNPIMRVGDQIAEVIKLHNNISKKEAKERAIEMLEMVGIPGDRYREFPHQFSGGMKQRVVIAIALACKPELLLADEPTTALDVTIQAQVLDMIKALQEKQNTSMILITHDLGVVAETCDYVAVVYAGQIVEYGNSEELFDQALHPYTLGLFGALPDMNNGEEHLHPVKGLPPDPSDLPKGCYFSPRCPYATEQCKKEQPEMTILNGTHQCRCMNLETVRASKEVK